MKQNADVCAPYLHNIVNSILESGIFPEKFKFAYLTAIFKTFDKTADKNYIPVSVLPTI